MCPFFYSKHEFIICRLYLNVENFSGIFSGKKKKKHKLFEL